MLQPLQLREVWSRYASEIAELQDFFLKADCSLGSPDSLAAIVNRLQRDRAFRRDLTSHLWVVIHARHGNASYADLLGMLAIAASGLHFAAEADGDDAHALLRFLMEAREGLDGVSEVKTTPVVSPLSSPVVASRAPLETAAGREYTTPGREYTTPDREYAAPEPRLHALPAEPPAFVTEETGGSRRRWAVIAIFVLAGACTWLVIHSRSASSSATSQSPVVVPAPTISKEETPSVLPSETETAPVTEAAPVAAGTSSARKSQANLGSHAYPAQRSYPPAEAAPVAVKASPAQPARATTTAAIAPPIVPAPVLRASPPAPKAAPTNTVAATPAQPGARPVGNLGYGSAVVADFSHITPSERPGPRLRRRTPEEQNDLLADSQPPNIATAAAARSTAAPAGIVRAQSLGASASNVIYSPTPAYPAAASAAHVQGDVKLETQVDRNGNISSIRVISGPPLLREAALNAAQRWRYTPSKVAGRAIPMSAITIFEFQLP